MKSSIKKISMTITCLLFSIVLSAQVVVTVNNTPGQLKNNLSGKDPNSIVSLTITGTMDARDFRFMRDSMAVLAEIDMSAASVEYYIGKEGPMSDLWDYEYPANKVPSHAFCDPVTYEGKKSLVSVKLPKVRAVLYNSFWGCTNLQTVVFPPTVTTIGQRAFYNCTSLVNMEIPPFLKSLEGMVFDSCTSLTSITWPSTLKSGDFANCTGLRSIHIVSRTPKDFSLPNNSTNYIQYAFENVDKELCILYVPYGTKALYEAADGWNDFKNIVEDSTGFILNTDSLQIAPYGASDNSVHIKANKEWTAVSNQPWLTVSSSTGNSDADLIITAESSSLMIPRQGILTFTAEGSPERHITIIQQANIGSLGVTPGSLSAELDKGERNIVTSLELAGEMDARDFKTIRDELPNLKELVLSAVSIVNYSGLKGTVAGMTDYPANEIPPYALYDKHDYYGNRHLRAVNLPSSISAIREYAFTNCYQLSYLDIPWEVTFIGRNAFENCYYMFDFIIPRGISSLEPEVFSGCYIRIAWLPSSLTTIKDSAFAYCFNLYKAYIPASVKTIGAYTFSYCWELRFLYAYPVIPPDLINSPNVFYEVNKQECVLYVPKGSKELYALADQWKDFFNIVEMDTYDNQSFDAKVMTTGADEKEVGPAIKCYPNPFTNWMTMEVANPSLREVNIEIFSMSGQKIKTLLKSQKGQKISLTWDGRDESAKPVPAGIYLMKVNEVTRKLVKK